MSRGKCVVPQGKPSHVRFPPIADISGSGHDPNMEDVSDRLFDQRARNSIIFEPLELVEWRRSLKKYGPDEYHESFFTWFPESGEPYPNVAITIEERLALQEVQALMIEASRTDYFDLSSEEFIATGWPERIAPVAASALRVMLARGLFSSDREEPAPTGAWIYEDRFPALG